MVFPRSKAIVAITALFLIMLPVWFDEALLPLFGVLFIFSMSLQWGLRGGVIAASFSSLIFFLSTMLFNTDGITEQAVGADLYGERLKEVFYKHSQLPPDTIVEKIKDDFKVFNNGSLQGRDDITFLVIQMKERE